MTKKVATPLSPSHTAALALLLGVTAILLSGSEALAFWKDNCRQEGGTPVEKVTVSKCRGGKQTVTIRFDKNRTESQAQQCENKGSKKKIVPTGYTYEPEFWSSLGLDGVCVRKTGSGMWTWNDGASEPYIAALVKADIFALYKSLFRPAGVRHDHCFHHGLATYGFDKLYCDKEFLKIAKDRCSDRFAWQTINNALNIGVLPARAVCLAQAGTFYTALRRTEQAKDAWEYTNTVASYLPARHYRLNNGSIFYVNGEGRYCHMTPSVYASHGRPNAKQLNTNTYPRDLKSDGACRPGGPKWRVSYGGSTKWDVVNYSKKKVHELLFGDFNGDGTTDVLRADGKKWWVSWGGRGKWEVLNTSKKRVDELRVGDFDGDGADDIFRANGTRWYVSHGGRGEWIGLARSATRVDELAFGDFNKDRKTDVFKTTRGQWKVSYGGASRWQNLARSGVKLEHLRFGDLNGDGKTDVFKTTGSRWQVSYGGTSRWTNLASSSASIKKLALADVDGDNKDDVFYASGSQWFFSSGGKSNWKKLARSSTKMEHLAFGDFGSATSTYGDGKVDVFSRAAK